MNQSDALALATRIVDIASSNGVEGAEADVSIVRRFQVEARDKVVSKLEHSTGRTIHVRLFSGGRRVSFTTSDGTIESVTDMVRAAAEQARFVAADEFAALPESCAAFASDLQLFDPAIDERDDAVKVDDALSLEHSVRDADARIVNSNGSHYSDAVIARALANSRGFSGAFVATRASRSSSPVAEDGEAKRTAHYGTAARHLHELEVAGSVARTAARRTIEMFGARKPGTARLPVIFERDIAAAVLDDLFAAVNAANVAIGNSWLIGRIGEKIGSDLVNVADDGTLPGKLGSSPFDGEGVVTRRTPVFERGVLKTFLYDSYYARKLGAATTANSTGDGIGPNNFYLEPGTATLEELVASTQRGVLVLDTIGFATEHATGTYSRGARGFAIENGELAYPIDEFTIAGSFVSMLAGIDGVANDLRFDGAVVAPSFRVAEMTISGN